MAVPLQANQDYRYHSIFFFNFARYTFWPAEYSSGDFVIGILGDSKIQEPLEDMAAQRNIRNQKIVVKTFNSVNEVGWCHMLFVPFERSNELASVLSRLDDQSTMIVTEKPGLGQQGSTINFVLVNGRWRFELNNSAARNSNLRVSNELTELAIQIN